MKSITKHILIIKVLYLFLFIYPHSVISQTIAFPGADGYGKYTTGGRGGKIIEVTNLNDNGEGSLRSAINTSGARIIVFKISGRIALKSDLRITKGNLTIAGQTAPGDGICLTGYSTIIDADNIIIRYVRFRPGDELNLTGVTSFENDGLFGREQKNIIIDHCSMSWAIDEVSSFYDNTNFTMQWCLIGESLYKSYHPKGNHSYGGIWGGMNASFHHNLIANHTSRTPRFCGARYHVASANLEIVDFRNNVIFNWGFNSTYGGEGGHQNIVNNYFKPGPATNGGVISRIVNPTYSSDPLVDSISYWYLNGNIMDGNTNVTDDNWLGFQPNGGALWSKVITPFNYIMDSTQSAGNAYISVLENCGASLPLRDTVDRRLIYGTMTGHCNYGATYGASSGIIDSQKDVGGYPSYFSAHCPIDTDHDGMPDFWELSEGLNPGDSTDRNSILHGDGFTAVEVYINSISEMGNFMIPPTDLKVKLTDLKTVKLDWTDNSNNETGFIIEVKDTGSFIIIDTLPMNTTMLVDTNIKFNTQYTYRVRGISINDSSVYSNEVSVTTLAEDGLPLKSEILFPSNNATDQKISLLLQWEAGIGTKSHNVYFGTTNPPVFICNTVETKYKPAYLDNNKQYYVRIDEVNDFGTTVGDIYTFKTKKAIDKSLVGYWNFDSIMVIQDVSGFNNHPVLHEIDSTCFSDSGAIGKGLFLNGSDQFLQVKHSSSIDFDINNFSVNFWVHQNLDELDKTKSYRYLVKGSNIYDSILGHSGKRYEVYYTPSKNIFRFCVDDDLVKSEVTANESYFICDKWTMVTAIRDKENSLLKLYANQDKVAEITDNTGDISQTEDLYISYCVDELAYVLGGLDEIRVYSYALTDQQIDSLYHLSVFESTESRINSLESNSSLSCYPNPVRNTFIIKLNMDKSEKVSINIVDIQGRLVQQLIQNQWVEKGIRVFNYSIDRQITNGLYLLNMTTNKMVFSQKLLILQ